MTPARVRPVARFVLTAAVGAALVFSAGALAGGGQGYHGGMKAKPGKRVHGPHNQASERVTVPDGFGPVRVETRDGTIIWIPQVQPGGVTLGDPYPGCLICHDQLENATINMLGMQLDCTWCHGGDPEAFTYADAHIFPDGTVTYDKTVPPRDQDLAYQQFVNPSNLRATDDTCGICHFNITDEIGKSMMATAAGHYAGGLYQNNVQDSKTPIYGTFAVSDDDGMVPIERGAVESLLDLLIFSGGDPELVATHFAAVPSQACARCHLWSRGKGYRGAENADGVYRADGCAACHMLYDNDGLSQSGDPNIDHAETGHPRQHVITRQIPTEQCLHCHHRGARIGLNFTGRAQMPPGLPSGPGVPGTTDERFNGNYHYTVEDTNPQDIHAEKGMHCIDCHVSSELMGDGNIYGHMDQATVIECRTCHGMPNEFPTLTDNAGSVLWHMRVDENDPPEDDVVILTSKVTGVEHITPVAMNVPSNNPAAACAMNANHLGGEGGLECYACHSSWVPNCYGCHFERDEREMGLNLMTGLYEVGRARTNNKIFESLRQFTIGPNSEGRVAPYIVACQPIADVTAPDGTKILDMVMPVTSNGLSGLAHNPVNPHTIRGVGEVRTCAECHRSPTTLGMGSGNYSIARVNLYAAGSSGLRVYDRNADPAQPVPDGDLIGTAQALAVASLPDAVEGVATYLYVARGPDGVAIYDRRPGAVEEPVTLIEGVNAIDVSRAARYVFVVDAGVGVNVYDNENPEIATLVATIPMATAVRAVPWGMYLFVAAGSEGLAVVDVRDHTNPEVVDILPGMFAADVQLYSHFQSGSSFAVRAYVADPSYGVHIVNLLPNIDSPSRVSGLPLPGAAGLDTYTRYVTASETEPSREHDYLYVAAGPSGMHVYDITDPNHIQPVAAVTDLGGSVVDVDVSSQLSPPGTDDYAMLANETLGLQVVLVNDPTAPVSHGTVVGSAPMTRVFSEVQQLDRFLDEQGNQLKDTSHPFITPWDHTNVVRILAASIECDTGNPPDLNGDGTVGFDDLLTLMAAWGPCPAPPAGCPGDINGDGSVDFYDLLELLANWG